MELTAELQRRIQAMEMRCYRKILHISYKDHVNNEEVRAKIQQAIGPHEDLLTISEGSGEQGKMDKTGCKIICGAPSTLAVKGLMMMMMTFVLCFRIIYCNLWQGKCYPPFDGAI